MVSRVVRLKFVLWPTLAGGHPVSQAVLMNTLVGAPVLLHPRMGPTPEHAVHRNARLPEQVLPWPSR